MNIQIPEQKRWLQQRMEPTRNRGRSIARPALRALERLIEAEEFEHFLHARFVGHKRFSLEGARIGDGDPGRDCSTVPPTTTCMKP